MKNYFAFVVFILLFGFGSFPMEKTFAEVPVSEEIRYDSGGRRDPFMPLIGPEGIIRFGIDPSGLNIEGIIFDPDAGSIALINGQFYKQGDTVQNMNVVSIFKDHVILAKDDQEKTLWMNEENSEEGEIKNENKKEHA